MPKDILIIDDDALLRRSLSFSLGRAGYNVNTVATAEDGLALARRDPPDLVLLDIGLTGMDGLEALRRFKDHIGSPVIFLTARRRELDQVLGLEMGADDYVTKPFDLDVLIARIKAVLRRQCGTAAERPENKAVVVGDITIDPGAHIVTVGGTPVELPPRQFDLLYALAIQAGRVVSVNDLLNQVWGSEFCGQAEAVYVHIRWLRERLEDDPQHPRRIVTIRGVGYKLEPQGN